jgi:hypothetical protein
LLKFPAQRLLDADFNRIEAKNPRSYAEIKSYFAHFHFVNKILAIARARWDCGEEIPRAFNYAK